MKLKCENIGKLKSAEVEINTITVIAGLNSTGKSTVGKVLYCIFNSFYDLDSNSNQKLFSVLRRYIEDDKLIFDPSTKTDNCARALLKQRNKASNDEVRNIISSYMGESFFKNKKENIVDEIVDLLNISNDVLYSSLLLNKFFQEFEQQIQNFNSPDKESSIELTIANNTIQVKLNNNNIQSIKNYMNLKTEVIYIDDPFVLDTLNKRPSFNVGHKAELWNKLRKNVSKESELEKVISDIILTKKIDKIYEKINSVCKGNIIFSQKNGFTFHTDNVKKDLSLINISTGLKAFVIIKTLLLNGSIEQNGTIVLDEPEIHLHPQWQLLLAEVIVLIQKEFNMHILINSHSPYFIDAIDTYAQYYGIRESCKFYLSEETTDESATLKDVSSNITEIYELLYKPMQDLENILSNKNNGDE